MKYLYVGATPEVERQAYDAVRHRVESEFGVAVREMELAAVDFAYDRERGPFCADCARVPARSCSFQE